MAVTVSIQTGAPGVRMRMPARSAGAADGLVGPELPLALPPVEAQDLMAGGCAQLPDPLLEERRGDDLADAFEARRKVGRAEHAELVLEDGETAAIDDDRDAARRRAPARARPRPVRAASSGRA